MTDSQPCTTCGARPARRIFSSGVLCDRCAVLVLAGGAVDLPAEGEDIGEIGDILDFGAFDDEEDEDLLAAWDQEEREAAGLLRRCLPKSVGAPAPESALREAAAAIKAGVRQDNWPHRRCGRLGRGAAPR